MKAVWEFLNSLKLTVYLILAITAVTMFGSMVLYVHPEIFGEMDNNILFFWLMSVGPQALQYTWWLYLLVALVVLLGVNTLVCTVERVPLLVKRYKDPLLNLKDIEVGGTVGREIALGGGDEALTGYLKARRYQVFRDGDSIYAEKDRWLPFMPYVIHVGIMVFMIAHLISGLFGYRHPGLTVFEGESIKSPEGGYYLRLNKFEYIPNPDGSPKNFGSNITAIKDGREIKTGWVRSNTPMFVEGSAIYQREFNQGFRGLYVSAEVKSAGYKGYVFVPKGADWVEIPGTGYRFSVDQFLPDFAVDERGMPYTQSEELANPAITLTLYKDSKAKANGLLVLRDPSANTFRDADVTLSLAGADVKMYSTFDINRDPSALLVLFASVTVMLATVVTLYFRRERVWVKLDASGKRAQVQCTDDELYEGMDSL